MRSEEEVMRLADEAARRLWTTLRDDARGRGCRCEMEVRVLAREESADVRALHDEWCPLLRAKDVN